MATKLLTVRQIEAAQAQALPYSLRDGGSLFLYIQKNGSKLWRYRYRIDGKGQVYAIGQYPRVTLQQARAERDRAHELVSQGIHPLIQKKLALARQLKANQDSFQKIACEWMASNPDWSPGYASQVQRYLNKDVFPRIGKLPISEIKAPHLRDILKAVSNRNANNAAILIRQWMGQIFSYAIVHDICDHNPAFYLKGLIKRPTVRHHPPLSWAELPVFLQGLDKLAGQRITIIALRLIALTFVRTVELRLAKWSEFDLDNALWEVPKERMKMRRPHLVPLSKQALTLLRELHTLTGHGSVLFPNQRTSSKVMAVTTLNRAIERLGYKGQFSTHGFRSTATTILGLLGYPDKRVDLQLAHRKKDGSRAPYDHAKLMSSRTATMQDWADILDMLAAGSGVHNVSCAFGTMSERRTALLRVIERE